MLEIIPWHRAHDYSNKWLSFTVTHYQRCSWSVFPCCSSLIVQMWSEKVVFINQCRANTRLNDDESQWDEADTSDFKATRGESTLTSWQHFCIQLGVHCAGGAAQELARARRHVLIPTESKKQANKQIHERTNTHQSPSFHRRVSSLQLGFSPLHSCFHIQTHSHSGEVIECDSKSWEGCWRVIRLTCEI